MNNSNNDNKKEGKPQNKKGSDKTPKKDDIMSEKSINDKDGEKIEKQKKDNNNLENDEMSQQKHELESDRDNVLNDNIELVEDNENNNCIAKENDIEVALKEAEVKEGDVVEIVYNDEHMDDQRHREAQDMIKDIIAEEEKNRDEVVHEKKDKKFMKRTLIRKIPFSIGNMDVYLHVKYQHVNVMVRCFIECFIIGVLFMIWPIMLFLILPKTKGYNLFNHLSKLDKYNPVSEFLRQNLFITLTYFVFIAFSLFFDNILFVTAFFLNIFGVPVQGKIGEILQVISACKIHLRNTFVSLVMFIIATNLVATYEFFSNHKDISFIFFTIIFWFSCVSAIMFIKTFIMSYLTSELRRKSFRNRIWDTNYKTFVFKKLAAIAEATPQGKHAQQEKIYEMRNDYDTGFFLRHNDLDLTSKESANEISEGIFGFLEIQELSYKMIKKFFPENYHEIYKYLSKDAYNDENNDETPSNISFELFNEVCVELYQERMDIARSMYDRDNILRKLDLILIAIVGFFAFIIFSILIDIDYKIYVTAIGPFIFGFGWIFQDSIKELYRCFIFHLINHPYDCGDRVKIDNEELTVLKIDLLYTTFVTVNGKIKYIPNTSMFLKNVENIRRSDTQAEDVSITISKDTKFGQLVDVRNKLSEEVKRLGKEFTGVVYIKNYEAAAANVKVIFTIEHSTNFQEIKQRLLRRDKFIKLLEKILDDEGIEYDHCFITSD